MTLYSMYKMFRFIKKVFYIGSLFLSSLVSTTPLMLIAMSPYFILLVLKQVNVVEAGTISMIHM